MLGPPPNASTIALYVETGTFPQWLKLYYQAIKYYVKAQECTTTEAVLKNLPNKRRNWNTRVSEIFP